MGGRSVAQGLYEWQEDDYMYLVMYISVHHMSEWNAYITASAHNKTSKTKIHACVNLCLLAVNNYQVNIN